MNEPKDDYREGQLAKSLEKLHQALLDSKRNSTDETPVSKPELIDVDDELRPAAELLSLLDQVKPVVGDSDPFKFSSADQDASKVLGRAAETLVDGDSQTIDDTEVEIASRLSRFEIIRELGQGGYGTVFLAREVNLNRNVALKFPRPEVLTRPDLKHRFIHEARAASTLSHPNIVSVYEAGKDGGLYFIASEFVQGMTLNDYLEENEPPLPAHDCAEMIAILAEAIAHAHDRGVIHRDLKPANILIDLGNEQDELNETSGSSISTDSIASRLRIADFGLSKTIGADSHDTRTGAIVGTPAYMAPEQTCSNDDDAGPAADIYSLGTILYRLLTGTIPFRHDSVLETIRAVQVSEPTAPRRLNSQIPLDLESICLKCLEKKPEQRYSSAFALADDLRKFRGGFPVVARPVTQIDRFIRWAKRNPALAVAGSLASAFLLVALAASLIGWSSTQNAFEREQIAKAQSEKRYHDFKQAVDTYFTKVCEDPRFQRLPQSEPLRQELLNLALTYYQEFAEENRDDPDLTLQVSQTLTQIGEIFAELGMHGDALEHFERALNGIAQLSILPSENRQETLLAKARTLDGAAMAHVSLGDTNTAAWLNDESIMIVEGLLDQEPAATLDVRLLWTEYQSNRKTILAQSNDYENALIAYLPVVETYGELSIQNPDDVELEFQSADSMVKVSDLLARVGKIPDAEKELDRSIVLLKDLNNREPTMWAVSESLVEALARKARFRIMQRDSNQAENLLLEAIPIVETLCLVQPTHVNYLLRNVAVHGDLATVYMQRRLGDQAKPHITTALRNAKRIMEIDPQATDGIRAVATNALNYGSFLADAESDLAGAEFQFRQSHEHWRRLEDLSQDNLQTQLGLANCATNLSRVIRQSKNNLVDSMQFADEAIEILQRQMAEFPENPAVKYYSFSGYGQRALVLRDLGRFEESIVDFRKRLELAPPPKIPETKADLALTLLKHGKFVESAELIKAVESLLKEDSFSGHGQLHLRVAQCHALLAAKQAAEGIEQETNVGLKSDHSAIALRHIDLALKSEDGADSMRNALNDDDWDTLRNLPEFQELVLNLKPDR